MIQACCTFLESQLDPSNALGIAAFAEQHHCSNICMKPQMISLINILFKYANV